jgi:hypothetical protein
MILKMSESTNNVLYHVVDNLSGKFGTKINELWDNFGSDFTYPGNLPAYIEEYFEDQDGRTTTPGQYTLQPIQCLPQPGLSLSFLLYNNYVLINCLYKRQSLLKRGFKR